MRTPTKTRNPRRTKSVSHPSTPGSAERLGRIDRGGDRRLDRLAPARRYDRRGGLARDLGDIAHRLGARRGDLALGGGQLGRETRPLSTLRFARASAAAASRCWATVAALARASAMFVRGRGGVGFLLHRGRLVEVARDQLLAGVDHRSEAGQAALGHAPVEEPERDREPAQAAREGARIERGKSSARRRPGRPASGSSRWAFGRAGALFTDPNKAKEQEGAARAFPAASE